MIDQGNNILDLQCDILLMHFRQSCKYRHIKVPKVYHKRANLNNILY